MITDIEIGWKKENRVGK